MERSRVSLIKQKSENPRPGIVNDLVEKFEKMQKMAEQETSPSLENKGKVMKLVLQYEKKIKGDAKQTRNSKLDCLIIRRNPIREAKEVAFDRIVRIQQFERSKNEKEIISRIKRQTDKSHEGTVNDMDRKLEKTRKIAEQERSPSLENKGKVRKLVLEYEERSKGDAKQTRNSKLDCLGIKRNVKREAKQVALATIVGIQKRSPSPENKERLKYHVMKYEEMIRNDAEHNRNMEQKDDLEGKSWDERKHLRRKAKDVAFVRIRQIAQDEISQQKRDMVYDPVQLREEALKDEKKEEKKKVKLEEIEEGIVERRIQYFENIIRRNTREEGHLLENIIRGNKKEGDLRGQSADLRKNLNRKAKDIALARITQIIQEELSEEQNENLWKSEKIEKELQDYQEANSSGTQGDPASNCDDYEEIIKVKVMGRKQTADLRRKAKDRAFLKIRQIAMEEVFPEKGGLVYALVQLWEEALKDEKIEKIKKVIHEVIGKGNVKRHVQKFENVIRGNLKEGDLRGQPRDFRNHLRRTTKDKALAQIRKVVQEEMAPEKTDLRENLKRKSENIEKELQDYQEANSSGTQGDSDSNCDDYEEIIKVKVMGCKPKAKIRNILQEVIKEENFEEASTNLYVHMKRSLYLFIKEQHTGRTLASFIYRASNNTYVHMRRSLYLFIKEHSILEDDSYLDDDVNDLDDNVNDLDDDVKNFDDDVNDLDDNINDLDDDVNDFDDDVNDFDGDVNDFDDDVNDLDNDVNNLDDDVNNLDDDVNDFDNDVNDFDNNVNDLDDNVNDLDDDVNDLDDDVNDLDDDVNDLDDDVNDLDDDVNDFDDDVNDLDDDVNDFDDDVNDLDDDVNDLDDDVNDFDDDVNDFDDDVNDLDDDVNDLDDDVNDFDNDINDLDDDVNDFDDNVNDFEDNVNDFNDDVNDFDDHNSDNDGFDDDDFNDDNFYDEGYVVKPPSNR
ncbi:putative leucine-rich repeat-containing protein DDB_G0290503 [Palaemon carinicauda]|uniref:putative leucine-rich repeat-containing protein DDB_G0290503 n=1 Tax=Palaemon carinicauda TaxID=392227 RepID=UPI0035B63450